MIEDRLIERVEPVLHELGSVREPGESFASPALDVLGYYPRSVRLSRIPFLGRALGLVMVARQPVDIEGTLEGYQRLLTRMAMAANGRYPPRTGWVLGLSAVVLTPEPIQPEDDAMLARALDVRLRRMRSVPFGLFRINLGQEAMAMAIRESPGGLFPEPARLGDLLCEQFRRYLPPMAI